MGVRMVANVSGLEAFRWEPQPEADRLVRGLVGDFLRSVEAASRLALRMREETGTRLFDWVDSLSVPASEALRGRLEETGFIASGEGGANVYEHPGAIFPRIVLWGDSRTVLALKVDSVADFLAAWRPAEELPIEGEPYAPLRRAVIARAGRFSLMIVERHGETAWSVRAQAREHAMVTARFLERFRLRQREWRDWHAGFAQARKVINKAVQELGKDQACAWFFAAEREYWQSRNHAAQVQKARQDRLGLGWANHDHHTYRSSRKCFVELIAALESLGMQCRERFYAGHEAGWGAQVLEQPRAGIVVFADVDLAAEEMRMDFAHESLAERRELGTVGLWCGLHGESFLEAGMHHLECQFDFAALAEQLRRVYEIPVMKPFTDLPYLRQAFTGGERWPVRNERVRELELQGLITPEQAEEFLRDGAIGSHLENLERNEGYKGFNQQGVSEIIAATDPRRGVGKW